MPRADNPGLPKFAGRVAVFQPRPGMGDLIWHLPLIRAIAAASDEGRITLITKPSTQAAALLEGDPAIERLVWFDHNPRVGRGRHDGPAGTPRLAASLRKIRADSCVLLHHSGLLAALMALAGIPNRYGYGYGLQRLWLNRRPFLQTAAPFTEAFDQASAYAQAAQLAPLPEPAIAVPASWTAAAQIRLSGLPAPLAVLGIGAQGVTRQWGAERFATLAVALTRMGAGTVLLAAASHEAELAETVRQRAGDERVRCAVGWDLPEIAATLAAADLFVGNDSGLLNLRAAVGRTAYGLFGMSGPLRHSRHIRAVVPSAGARAGMDALTVDHVVGTLLEDGILETGTSTEPAPDRSTSVGGCVPGPTGAEPEGEGERLGNDPRRRGRLYASLSADAANLPRSLTTS